MTSRPVTLVLLKEHLDDIKFVIRKHVRRPKTGSCANVIAETINRPYRLYRERNSDIRNTRRLKVNNLMEDMNYIRTAG
jgi:hypothetical protein